MGKNAVQLTGFSASTIDADSSLRTISVDAVRGTALYDGVILSAQALEQETLNARVLILLTDGQEVSSDATLTEAIAAARAAEMAVYPIAIESPSLSPAPLKRLAAETGGRYWAAQSTQALAAVYASIAEELRRTWQLSYTTSARPGEQLRLDAAGAHAEVRAPGRAGAGAGSGSVVPVVGLPPRPRPAGADRRRLCLRRHLHRDARSAGKRPAPADPAAPRPPGA